MYMPVAELPPSTTSRFPTMLRIHGFMHSMHVLAVSHTSCRLAACVCVQPSGLRTTVVLASGRYATSHSVPPPRGFIVMPKTASPACMPVTGSPAISVPEKSAHGIFSAESQAGYGSDQRGRFTSWMSTGLRAQAWMRMRRCTGSGWRGSGRTGSRRRYKSRH